MKVPCKNKDCYRRRAHHERPDEERGQQMVEVPDDHPAGKPVYCSYTCAGMDGAWSVTKGWFI